MKTDTIFALSTPFGKSGVALFRISGDKALSIIKQITKFLGDEDHFEPRYATLCAILDPKSKEEIDQGLVIYFKAPNSFTGEDTVEITTHGSIAVINEMLEMLNTIDDIRLAEPGEFTRRAFENGKMDLSQVEGLSDLIESETKMQRKQAYREMNGKLSAMCSTWREDLVKILSHFEAAIDFAEDEIPADIETKSEEKIKELITNIDKFLKTADKGIKLKNGLNISIIGVPNAGKSTLFNYILGEDRAITSETAGTTRDVIEAYIDVKGYPALLFDTAGIRDALDEIEDEGIKRALKKAENADLKILISDNAENIFFNENMIDENTIILLNKIDINKYDLKDIEKKLADKNIITIIPISIKENKNMDAFLRCFHEEIIKRMSTGTEIMITKMRHVKALKSAKSFLNAAIKEKQFDLKTENIRSASDEIGKITGKIRVEELLDQIFSGFCIGK